MASFERRFGDMNLGISLQKAIDSLGVGAKRKLVFDEVPEKTETATFGSK
jgi:hypothetical protein